MLFFSVGNSLSIDLLSKRYLYIKTTNHLRILFVADILPFSNMCQSNS